MEHEKEKDYGHNNEFSDDSCAFVGAGCGWGDDQGAGERVLPIGDAQRFFKAFARWLRRNGVRLES
jgi:hypothetical protein